MNCIIIVKLIAVKWLNTRHLVCLTESWSPDFNMVLSFMVTEFYGAAYVWSPPISQCYIHVLLLYTSYIICVLSQEKSIVTFSIHLGSCTSVYMNIYNLCNKGPFKNHFCGLGDSLATGVIIASLQYTPSIVASLNKGQPLNKGQMTTMLACWF